MSVPVAVIGAGGYGRELLDYAEDATTDGWGHHVVGFFDDDLTARNGWSGPPLLGAVADLVDSSIRHFTIAVGTSAGRRRLAELVAQAGKSLVSVRHPTAYVSRSATVGEGTILCPQSLVGSHGRVGANVSVNVYVSVGHDVRVGADSVLSPHAAIAGGADLGDGVFLGSHVTIATRTAVGSWSQVVANSFVKNDAPEGSFLHGSPAKGRVMYRAP